MRQGLVDFSVAERVKRFDGWENDVFLPDCLESDGHFACKSGKITLLAGLVDFSVAERVKRFD